MQLKVTTDYAIRIVLYAAMKRETENRISSVEMSEKLGIPQSVVLKLGAKLKTGGILDVRAGTDGGVYLKKKPKDVSLFDIINMVEPTMQINRCLEDERDRSCFSMDDSPVRKTYILLQQTIEKQLKGTSFQDLMDGQVL